MSTYRTITCPDCGCSIEVYANPAPTVDIIIETESPGAPGIVLIQRENPPFGWAIPGGFVDYGESAEDAALREAKEETGLAVTLKGILGVYSDPRRDSRQHTISTVFVATARGTPAAGDDAVDVAIFGIESLPQDIAFDHSVILGHYAQVRRGERQLCACRQTKSPEPQGYPQSP